ncbi:hypothetical protein EGW08_004369 [Elysia chlorotica]|uniref:G-protein coupled receptors family 1 profile domain-containing protein n=1 Tax=Elysia chlorotica TaxID=188477 RepID=A0A3S1BNM5_ELYCH|nr:hypothetical protein EGW08_004369 [Elysia chlorotica]
MIVCEENVCAMYCAATHASRNATLLVPEVTQCIFDACDIQVSYDETKFIIRQTKAMMSLEGRNWSQGLKQAFDQSNCADAPGPAMRLDNLDTRYTVPINGFLSPIVIVLAVFTNSLVCLVLLKPHMRSPTTIILLALAISDMLTGLFPLPVFIYFYSTDRVHEWVPYRWCWIMHLFSEYIPTIFHTASIWLTVALATQRYICVCHVFKARTWCTFQNTVATIAFVFTFAILTHSSRFFEMYSVETVRVSVLNPNNTVSACAMKHRPWVRRDMNLYYNIYYWFRVVFIHFIPCVSLVVMTALLVHTMRAAQWRRRQLQLQNEQRDNSKLGESNRTTMMLLVVVVLFLLVEVPLGLLMVFLILQQTFDLIIISVELMHILSLFSNFFILLSYPLNFFIYCGMSRQFRDTFKRLLTRTGIETSCGSEIIPV